MSTGDRQGEDRAARLAAISARVQAATPGNTVQPVGSIGGVSIALTCIEPAARDLLDRAEEGWEQQLAALKAAGTPPSDPVYAFAYWLCRWSGLVDAAAPADRADLLAEVRRLEVLLSHLTPGGSEFANNPDRCAEWVRQWVADMTQQAVTAAGERNQAQERVARLEQALRALVTADDAGCLDVTSMAGGCVYCDAAMWRGGTHQPDCPIVAGRRALGLEAGQ